MTGETINERIKRGRCIDCNAPDLAMNYETGFMEVKCERCKREDAAARARQPRLSDAKWHERHKREGVDLLDQLLKGDS